VHVEEYAYCVNKLHQNVGLETGIQRQIVTSQTAHSKYKWPPCATQWNPTPWKFSAYTTDKFPAVFLTLMQKLQAYLKIITSTFKEQPLRMSATTW